jgi:hypothetical protein
MQTYLVPFTAPGYTQPQGGRFERTAQEGPVSLGKLAGSGFLEPTVNSLEGFYYATTANAQNDRPHGGFPVYGVKFATTQPLLQRIQDFLNKYGEIMVEEKLLAP